MKASAITWRELFQCLWPHRTKEGELNPEDVFQKYIDAIATIERRPPSPNDAKLLDLSLKLFDNDAARRTSIDGRAAALMPAITIAVTLVSGIGFSALKDIGNILPIVAWTIFLTYLLSLLYLTRTVIETFRILGVCSSVHARPDRCCAASGGNTFRLFTGSLSGYAWIHGGKL